MSLDFTAGATLTVKRATGASAYDKLGDAQPVDTSHEIGPCGLIDSHGQVNHNSDGTARWVGTVTVEAPPDSDVKVLDRILLPSGEEGLVIQPPERPRNPFTGWTPYITFRMATPGYTPQP